MAIGDIVLVNTSPPHIASVTGDNFVLCEDGTAMPFDCDNMPVLFDALSIVKELEKGVLGHCETWRLCDCQ